MKKSDHVELITGSLSPEVCDELFKEFENLHDARFVHRTYLQRGRGVSDLTCDYHCALNKTLGVAFYERLLALAPVIPGCKVAEIVVNRYSPGQGMPDHRDRTTYKHNFTIPVQATGDGVVIEDEFYPDEKGRAVVFHGIGPVHRVPPVKHKRYVLIYLYE